MALSDNLIAYWPLDEASGNAIDVHGSNDLTETGGTIASTTGKISNCRDFEALDTEYFTRADNTDLSTGDIDFTITYWCRLESKPSFADVISKNENTAPNQEYTIGYRGDAVDRFRVFVVNGANSASVTADSLGSPSIGVWYFIVVWHDATGNTLNIQINGGPVDSVSYSEGVADAASNFSIGCRGNGVVAFFDGLIDEVGFWKRVLTSDERAELYNGGNGRDYNYIINELPVNVNKILLRALFPSILDSLEPFYQTLSNAVISDVNYTFPMIFSLFKNKNAFNNSKFNINNNLLKNTIAQIISEHNINFDNLNSSNAQQNKRFSIDYDLVKNNIGQTNKQYITTFNLNKNITAQSNKNFNLSFNLRKNIQTQLNKTFAVEFDLLSNRNILGNKTFSIDINNLNPLIALINKKFNFNINLRKNTNALIGPDFNILFGASSSLSAANDFNFAFPLLFDLFANKIGLINSSFNINYDIIKNSIALINPDFDILFNQFKQTQSQKQSFYDIDFNLLYDILLVEAGSNTFLVDYVFSILFNLLSNKNALNHTNLGINLDLNKSVLYQKDRQFNLPLNISQQGIRLKNTDLSVPLGGLISNLDALKETIFNLDLDFNKQLNASIGTEFETTFAIPKNIAANLNYKFPLTIQFTHDINTVTLISIVPDNIDDTLWCHVKTIKISNDVKAGKICVGIDKIARYGVEE